MKLFAFLSLTLVIFVFSPVSSYGQQQDPVPAGPSMTLPGSLNFETIGAPPINCIYTRLPGLTLPETVSGRMAGPAPLRDWKLGTGSTQSPPG